MSEQDTNRSLETSEFPETKHPERKLPIIKTLVVITAREKAASIEKLYAEKGVHLAFQFMAEGTASSEWLDILGLGHSDKVVTICFAPCAVTDKLIHEVKIRFELVLPGRGIAFTIPLTGAAGYIARVLSEHSLEEIQKRVDERAYEINQQLGEDVKEIQKHFETEVNHLKKQFESEVNKLKTSASHDIVLAVINQGYSEELMDAASAAGANGGTVFHARRMSPDDTVKFWGITVQREKEVVAILIEHEKKIELMKALSLKCGLTTEAQGIIVSLPVDSVAGLTAAVDND